MPFDHKILTSLSLSGIPAIEGVQIMMHIKRNHSSADTTHHQQLHFVCSWPIDGLCDSP